MDPWCTRIKWYQTISIKYFIKNLFHFHNKFQRETFSTYEICHFSIYHTTISARSQAENCYKWKAPAVQELSYWVCRKGSLSSRFFNRFSKGYGYFNNWIKILKPWKFRSNKPLSFQELLSQNQALCRPHQHYKLDVTHKWDFKNFVWEKRWADCDEITTKGETGLGIGANFT